MIDQDKLLGSVCRIECGGQNGTGFFISETTILTCYHVVVKSRDGTAIILTQNNVPVAVTLTAFCVKSDLAILKVVDETVSPHYLSLRRSAIVSKSNWNTFGHPANQPGQIIGEPLDGTIAIVFPAAASEVSIYDLTCNVTPTGAANPTYKGFSGAPMVNDSGSVIGVLKYQGSIHLHGISIVKGNTFLCGQNLPILPDELDGFDDYQEFAFEGFSSDAKAICKDISTEVAKDTSPTSITGSLKGGVYFPTKPGTLEEMVEGMKTDTKNNSLLWTGWLELLSHVALMKGEHKNINTITITLPAEKFTKWMGLVSKETPEQKLQLRFYWTDEENYFTVLKEYLRGKNRTGMEKNSCHIFNSKSRNFGGDPLLPGFKKDIIRDISYVSRSGPSVMANVNYGLLSLRHLNNAVKQCNTVADATKNLEKLFKDAIKQS